MKKNVVLISGMSGAGKSTAVQIMEDLGYYCMDNFPVSLLEELVETIEHSEDPRYEHIALATSAQDFPSFLSHLNDTNMDVHVIFLDASDATLLHRYKSTRRNHPFLLSDAANTLEEAIQMERKMFQDMGNDTMSVIDTSFISAKQLRRRLESWFAKDLKPVFAISFISFGYKHGVPMDADLLFDVRFLPNPYWEESLRSMTGNDAEVYDWVMEKEQTKVFIEKLTEFLDYAFEQYALEGKNHFTVGIGCTGGQHRSVTLTNYLYDHYRDAYRCYKAHRDIKEKDND